MPRWPTVQQLGSLDHEQLLAAYVDAAVQSESAAGRDQHRAFDAAIAAFNELMHRGRGDALRPFLAASDPRLRLKAAIDMLWVDAAAAEVVLQDISETDPSLRAITAPMTLREVLKRRDSRYRGGSRAGWSKVKDRSWYEREAWRFERR